MSTTGKPISNLLGKSFNRLTVVKYLGKRNHGKHWWLCKCECGGTVELNTSRITGNSPTKSCGCIRKEKLIENRYDPTKHGLHKHKLYAIYHGMLQRCYNPKSQRYMYYGSSGISVCAEWRESFENFFRWAIVSGYKEGLSIDRLDSAEDYTPENCQWVTVSENSRRMNESRREV
jgi:hypothetical protein